MSEYSFYHKDTGLIHPQHLLTDDAGLVARNTPPDHIPVEGHHDHLSKRVDIGNYTTTQEKPSPYGCDSTLRPVTRINVIDYQPPAPDDQHVWNAETKRWELSQAVQAALRARWEALRQIGQLEAQAISPLCELALGLPRAADKVKEIYGQIQALRAGISEQ